MISIKWDKINKKWITANIKEEWYNYNNKEWVNGIGRERKGRILSK